MQFNIDGYPSDSPDATQFFGTEAEKLGVTLLLLQDTRRTEYSGTALTRNVDIGRRQQQRRQNTKEERWVWRHEERIKEIQIGGVTTGMTERLHRWVGHDKDHKPAVIKDCRGLGRYGAVKLLGRKNEGVQRTMLIVNVYVPQATGALAKEIAKRGENEQQNAGEYATTQLINDLDRMIKSNATPGTAIIIAGDLNMWLQNASPRQNKMIGAWEKTMCEGHGLVNIFGDDDTQRTYINKKSATWPDHTYVSSTLIEAKMVRLPRVIGTWRKYGKDKGVMNSVHVPTVVQVNMEGWLDRSTAKEYGDRRVRPRVRTLKFKNKKQVEQYQRAIKKRMERGESPNMNTIRKWHTDAAKWTKLPAEVQQGYTEVTKLMLHAEDDIVNRSIERRKQHRGFSKIWTPDIARRKHAATLYKQVLNGVGKIKWTPRRARKIAQRHIRQITKHTKGYEPPVLDIPSNQATPADIKKWMSKTKAKLRKLEKKLHAKALKHQTQKTNAIRRKMATERENREYGAYIQKALGRKTQRLPTHMQVTKTGPNGKAYQDIVDDPDELKELLKDSTWEELGKPGREKWYVQSEHAIADNGERGRSIRSALCHGTEIERKEAIQTLPIAFQRTAKTLQAKLCPRGKHQGRACPEHEYAATMTDIDRETWNRKLKKKKKNTAPGENGIRVDHIVAAPDALQDVLRGLCNIAIRAKQPLDEWYTELVNKVPKDIGITKIDRLRPLKFLDVVRKLVVGIIKDRMCAVWIQNGLLSEEQYAFIADRNITTPAITRRLMMEDAQSRQRPLVLLDIDLTHGYDTVETWVKDAALRRLGVPADLRNFLANFDQHNVNKVITPYGHTEGFHAEAAALPQGDEASPMIWNAIMDMMLQHTKDDTGHYEFVGEEGKMETIQQIIYADDSTFFKANVADAQTTAAAMANFTGFTGLEINAKKSTATINKYGRETYGAVEDEPTPITVTEWAWNATTETVEQGKPNKIRWTKAGEHIRHLGNYQNTEGANDQQMKVIQQEIRKVIAAIRWKRLGAAGTKLINDLILTAKVRYAMTISNCNKAQIRKLQSMVTPLLCHANGISSKTAHRRLYGEAGGAKWDRWEHIVMIDRLKYIACELQKPATMGYKAVQGALHRMQQKYGGGKPVLQIDEAECITDAETKTEWIYTVWEWAQENGIRMLHGGDTDKPRRERDCRLMDSVGNMQQKRAINRNIHKYKWLSDAVDESGRQMNEAAKSNTDTEWVSTVTDIIASKTRQLGKWLTDTDVETTHKQRLQAAGYGVDQKGRAWQITGEDEEITAQHTETHVPYDGEWMDLSPGHCIKVATKCKCRNTVTYTGKGDFRMTAECAREKFFCNEQRDGQQIWRVHYENGEPEATATMLPEGAIIESIGDYTLNNTTTEQDITKAIRETRGEITITATINSTVMRGGNKGDVSKRAMECYKNTRVKLDDDTWAKIIKIYKHTTTAARPTDEQTTKRKRTQRPQAKVEWRAQLQGEDGNTTPATPTLKEFNMAVKQIYDTASRETRDCNQHKSTEIRSTARRINWYDRYVTRPRITADATTRIQHIHQCEPPTHPGWGEIDKRKEMRVYTDGSYRPEKEEGTYAWVAGWHDEEGNIGVVMSGGGLERNSDNEARGDIDSTRMETMGLIRAHEAVRRKWNGPVLHYMDNKATIWRKGSFARETARVRWKAPDSDLWNQAGEIAGDGKWRTKWVGSHADDDKKFHELTNEERGNVIADKHAEKQYSKPSNIETPWQDERNTRPGQIIIETGIRRYHPVTGRTTKTILKHTRTLATRLALDRELEHITRDTDINVNFDFLDMKLQENIERNDKKKGQLIRHMKLTAGILATNDRLATYTDTEAKCPCCGAEKETQNHILGHCPHVELVKKRTELIEQVHQTIGDAVGRHIHANEMELVKQIWTTKSIRGVAGQTANHEHEQYDWSETENPILRQYMEKLTEPGATKMWDGWFTVHWIPIIMDMASRQNHNAKRANTYNIAVKAAEKIRNVIKQGLYEMWKVRNDIKHEEHAKHKWTIVEIKDILRNLRKTNTTERYSAEEILTWRKRKIDSWAKRRMKDIEKGTKKQQEDKAALQRFNEKWKLFKPQHQDQEKDDEKETEDNGNHETRSDGLDQSEESKERIEDGSGVTRATDTENSQSTRDDTTTTEEEQEQADDGQNNTYTKNTVGRGRAERNQRESSEEHRGSGKRKEREQAGLKENDSEVKRKPRKKARQNTLEQYMNMDGGGKRKRDQAAHSDAHSKETSDIDDERETRRPKRTEPRQTEEKERKGIG